VSKSDPITPKKTYSRFLPKTTFEKSKSSPCHTLGYKETLWQGLDSYYREKKVFGRKSMYVILPFSLYQIAPQGFHDLGVYKEIWHFFKY